MSIPITDEKYLYSIWGNSSNNVYAGSSGGIILHYNGSSWSIVHNSLGPNFYDIWGLSADNIYAVGWGTDYSFDFYHYDGVNWTINEDFPKIDAINGVWGSSSTDIFFASDNGILHYTTPTDTPVLSVNSVSESVSSFSGTTTFSITNAGTGSLTWTAEENCPWFSVSPLSGTALGTLTVNYQSNPGDERTGKIVITADGAENSPKEITITQAAKQGVHFTPVWTGNPYNRMNFWVVGANLNGIPLAIGDEIAIFDGNRCVGMAITDQTPSYDNILSIKASQDDGSGNGFTEGNTITFKFWDASAGKEITLVTPNFKNLTDGNPVDAPLFEGMGDYGVTLSSGAGNQQSISLNKGWNIMSSYIVPQNTDMLSVVQPLIDNGTLNKVISETGDTIINVFGNWVNTIGNYEPEEGYKVKLNNGSQLLITGASSAPAMSNMFAASASVSIPLTAGWNLVSYPFTEGQDAMAVVQPLIDAGVLDKVIDETGDSILKVFGNWKNRIGSLMPGEGYEIKVKENITLILNESGTSARNKTSGAHLRSTPTHFQPVWSGNPFEPMNLWIAGIDTATLSVGDEIAVYDGTKCVGAEAIEGAISYDMPLKICISKDDGTGNGFTAGNPITFRFWDKSTGIEITAPTPNYMDLETGTQITAPTFKAKEDYGVTWNAIDYTGDVNHSGEVNLGDAILVLQMLSGLTVENIYTDADVSSDDVIGIEEAIYALQHVAELK